MYKGFKFEDLSEVTSVNKCVCFYDLTKKSVPVIIITEIKEFTEYTIEFIELDNKSKEFKECNTKELWIYNNILLKKMDFKNNSCATGSYFDVLQELIRLRVI